MNLKHLNLLLADDDTDDCIFFKAALEKLPLSTHLTTVHDGEQLMHLLLKETYELPHVLFLDLNMPRKNGMECLTEIRRNNKFKDLTVAIYSTSAFDKDIEKAFNTGANMYIRKPNDFDALKNILAKVMNINWQHHTSSLNKENFLLNI